MWFLIIQSSSEERREHALKPGQNTVGRRADNDIVLQDAAASGWHADIFWDVSQDTVTIRDLDSTNGTFVNGKRIRDVYTLHHEDRVRVGLCFLTLINSEIGASDRRPTPQARTKVTSELILQSVDNYGALIHEIGQRLVTIPDLDHALFEITELIKRMIGAEECRIILADKFGQLDEQAIPASLVQATIQHRTAIPRTDADTAGSGLTSDNSQSITDHLKAIAFTAGSPSSRKPPTSRFTHLRPSARGFTTRFTSTCAASTSAEVSSRAFPSRGFSDTPICSGVSCTSTSTAAPSLSMSPTQNARARSTFSGASRGGGGPSLPVVSSMVLSLPVTSRARRPPPGASS